MKTCFLLFVFTFLLQKVPLADTTCVKQSGVGDFPIVRPVLTNQIGTTHFIIHWESPTIQTYAQNAASYAEYAYEKQCGVNGMNWRVPPPDDNRGGDNRYDIYIVEETYPDIQGSRGITSWEIIGNWNYEWAPSFILIINTLQDNDLKMVVAHEFNHASQLAYTYKDLYINNGQIIDTWFYENTAVWMAEMTYEYSYNYYQRYFGVDPLHYPELGIHSIAPDLGWYNYAGFLWPKFLAEWRNDNDIIRKIWNRMGIIQGENIFNDVNIILLSQYSSNLNEAVRYYAEWRYFTGTRDDEMHFLNAVNLPTSTIYNQTQPQRLDGFGGTRFIQFNPTEELIEISFNGDDAVNWSAHVIEHKYIPPSINKSITLNSVYEGSIEAITEDCQYIVLTPILLSDVYKKYFTHSASMIDARKVLFTNKIGSSNAGGNLKLDNNTENIPSGESKWLRFNTTPHNIKTLNERFINSNIYKHNNWNGDVTKFFLNKNFTVQNANNTHNANFFQLQPATIRNVIDGISFNDQLPVLFNDPWYVKDQYDNQSGMGDFISPQSPYYPTGKYSETSGGVFLNQPYTGNNPVFYSVKVPQAVQNLYLPHTGRYHNFYFMGWTGIEVQFQDAIALQTGVVFKDDIQGVDPVVNANYKGTQLSSQTNAYSNNSQRKFVRTDDGWMHNVYSSMGRVWYEAKSPTGNWEIMNGGNPIDDGLDKQAKLPSIDYSYFTGSQENYNQLFIVYQEKFGSNSKVKVKYFHSISGGSYFFVYQSDIATVPGNYADINTTPVVGSYNGNFTVVWKNGTGNLYASYGSVNINNGITIHSSNSLTGTTSNSVNPSIYSSKTCCTWIEKLAWEEFSGGSSSIKFATISNSQIIGTIHTPSEDNGYTRNYNPSVVSFGDNAALCWIAYRKYAVPDDPGGGSGGNNGPGDPQPLGETKVFFRRFTDGSWTQPASYGNNINSVSINRNSDNSFAFAWSEGSTSLNKFVRSDNPALVYNTNTTGAHIQVGNFNSLNTMRLNSFKNTDLPYYFTVSEPFTIDQHESIVEREGVIVQDTTAFYFALGEISVDGQKLDFIIVPDTLNIENKETLNTYLLTEPFLLTNSSSFVYSVKYGITDSLAALLALSNGGSVRFRVELIDEQTGEILGTFDDVTYTSENIIPYENIAYQVNTEGIGSRTCRLRLVTEDNLVFNYSLVKSYDNEGTLFKKGLVQRRLELNDVVTSYDLAQNHPNPFNPSTTIRYQLPKDGMVTLKVYDILGAEVVTLVNEEKIAGRYEVNFNASSLASGVYIYRLNVNDYVSVKKMVMLK